MALAPVGSCDVSDACDQLGISVVRTGLLQPAWQGCPPLSGLLTTVRLEPRSGAPLPQLLDVLARSDERIVLIDLGGLVEAQCWGEVLATAARRFGVRGALVNGAVRDVDGLQQLGFPTYARGVYPARMSGRLAVVAVDEPVHFDAATVEPDAFAVVDASGAVFVPGDQATDAVALAVELRGREVAQLQAIRDGADPRQVLDPEPDGNLR